MSIRKKIGDRYFKLGERFFGKRSAPPPIQFGDRLRVEPISRLFGFDRGTPLDRFYIEKFLAANSGCIHGDCLEIAESTYSRRFGYDVKSCGILMYDQSNPKATIVGDLTKPETLPEKTVDCFIATQTLNFTFDVSAAVAGAYRLLRVGGVLLATAAGISQISRYDMERWGDFWRFTDLSIRRITEKVFGAGNVEVITYGNALSAMLMLQGVAQEDLPDKTVLDKTDADYQVIIGVKATRRN
ncbi:MAG: class I SAM-dependent methyltransferase [Planctomycetota bacterium]|jgi:hypothetical protein|nr:class I SAM-dependent methyltransferase [Planctomycetota bacterium]